MIALLIFFSVALAAQQDDLINPEDLKKFNINISPQQVYSGYLPVNEEGTAQFFYMFVLSDLTKPVTLWMNGGPGCSSLQGMFQENGPVHFIHKTADLVNNDYSWSKLSNILYLESPIGVGFSYGPAQNQTDSSTAKYNLQALISWFKRFDQFQKSPFYITGESYAGVYIPTLASEILDYNSQTKDFLINLKGIMIGNGCTHPTECSIKGQIYPQHVIRFMAQQNLISGDTYKLAMENLQTCYTTDPPSQCEEIMKKVGQEFSGKYNIDAYNVFGDCPLFKTDNNFTSKRNLEFHTLRFNIAPCSDDFGIYTILQNVEFMKVLRIDTTKSSTWEICKGVNYHIGDEVSYYLYPKLIQSGLRIWKYSGDIDSVVPITGTLYWINLLQNEYHLPTLVKWRPWYTYGELDQSRQVAGRFWKIEGLTFVSVKDAGHMVPTNKRKESYEMLEAFINNVDLPAE